MATDDFLRHLRSRATHLAWRRSRIAAGRLKPAKRRPRVELPRSDETTLETTLQRYESLGFNLLRKRVYLTLVKRSGGTDESAAQWIAERFEARQAASGQTMFRRLSPPRKPPRPRAPRPVVVSPRIYLSEFFNFGFESGGRVVAVTEAVQGSRSTELFDAIGTLPTDAQQFVQAILDGAELHEAAAEVELDGANLDALLPQLRDFLRPYLFG